MVKSVLPLEWVTGSIPGQGIKIPHPAEHKQKTKPKKQETNKWRDRSPSHGSGRCIKRQYAGEVFITAIISFSL